MKQNDLILQTVTKVAAFVILLLRWPSSWAVIIRQAAGLSEA